MDTSQVTIELIGRSSAWAVRVPAPREPGSSQRDQRSVVAGWLHHRSYGTLGVYLSDPPGSYGPLPEARQWVRLVGAVQPRRVAAL